MQSLTSNGTILSYYRLSPTELTTLLTYYLPSHTAAIHSFLAPLIHTLATQKSQVIHEDQLCNTSTT